MLVRYVKRNLPWQLQHGPAAVKREQDRGLGNEKTDRWRWGIAAQVRMTCARRRLENSSWLDLLVQWLLVKSHSETYACWQKHVEKKFAVNLPTTWWNLTVMRELHLLAMKTVKIVSPCPTLIVIVWHLKRLGVYQSYNCEAEDRTTEH